MLRRNGEGASSPGAHRQALLTLGGYAPHLAPEDAVQLVRQALEVGGLGQVAFAALVELQRMDGGRAVLLREADGLVAAACKAGRVRMAAMVVEEVQKERVVPPSSSSAPGRLGRGRRRREGPQAPAPVEEAEAAEGAEGAAAPLVSRASYLSFLRRLQQKGRPRSYWQLAEALIGYRGRPGAAVLGGDAEAAGLAMVVCWKAGNWRAVQRLLRESLFLSLSLFLVLLLCGWMSRGQLADDVCVSILANDQAPSWRTAGSACRRHGARRKEGKTTTRTRRRSSGWRRSLPRCVPPRRRKTAAAAAAAIAAAGS